MSSGMNVNAPTGAIDWGLPVGHEGKNNQHTECSCFGGDVGTGEPSRNETSLSPQRHLQPKRLRRREQKEERELICRQPTQRAAPTHCVSRSRASKRVVAQPMRQVTSNSIEKWPLR